MLVWDSLETLCSVGVQDILSTAYYWFNFERRIHLDILLKIVDWDIKHQHKLCFNLIQG